MTYNQVIKHYGSAKLLAEKFKSKTGKAHTSKIYNWQRTGIPYAAQLKIQKDTKGKLRAAL